MHLRIDPVRKGRVVYFNYVGGGTVTFDIILIRPDLQRDVEKKQSTKGISAVKRWN
jgi:hypothetical protein